jgi:hypothetical protein
VDLIFHPSATFTSATFGRVLWPSRPCRLKVERLAETARWFDHTRAAWEARLDRLERFLAQPQSPQPTVSKGEDNEP